MKRGRQPRRQPNQSSKVMKHTSVNHLSCLVLLLLTLGACGREDVGPYQNGEKTYALSGFDRLNMGSAFAITVRQGAAFSIVAEGDQRNIDDLDVHTRNGTLFARYRNPGRSRHFQTTFTITMPTLRGATFSGASQSDVTGFANLSSVDIALSGASKGRFAVQATRTTIDLSGASRLMVNGTGTALSAEVSGASVLDAFTYPVTEATVNVSGASRAEVSVANALAVDASGASSVRYRGTPTVRQRLSGASTVQND